MSNPRGINGADVVLVVDGVQIPAQRSLQQSETTASIDMSSKDSRGMRRASYANRPIQVANELDQIIKAIEVYS